MPPPRWSSAWPASRRRRRAVWCLSAYTSRLISSKPFADFRQVAKGISSLFPEEIQQINAKIDEYARGIVTGGTLFEELGFYYIGPVDGHDLDNLIPILENVRDRGGNQPVLLHIKTEKGYGYPPAEAASDKYHGVPKFDVATGRKLSPPSKAPMVTFGATPPLTIDSSTPSEEPTQVSSEAPATSPPSKASGRR